MILSINSQMFAIFGAILAEQFTTFVSEVGRENIEREDKCESKLQKKKKKEKALRKTTYIATSYASLTWKAHLRNKFLGISQILQKMLAAPENRKRSAKKII